MSEIFDLRGSHSGLNTVGAREERPVVLPFPKGEVREDSEPTSDSSSNMTSGNGYAAVPALPLIKKLCETLNSQQISYCHWKSNWKLNLWLQGNGDLDLLVDRGDAHRFVSLIYGLGFKQAEPPGDRAVPGILNFYGFDGEANKFVHLHVHYQLVIGHDLTKNYHLPIEDLYLEHSNRPGLIPIPEREVELILFVLRMVLKYSVLETLWRRMFQRSAVNAVEQELEHLLANIDRERVANLLAHVAPEVDNAFFDTCLQSLRCSDALWRRTVIRQEMQRRLRSCSRRPQTADVLLKVCRRATRVVRERMFHQFARKRFVDGGLLIAVVGGDGAGKTTTLNALDAWLSKKFVTRRVHLGKPPRSLVSLAAIVILRTRRLFKGDSTLTGRRLGFNNTTAFPGYVQLVRWVSAGRDRCRLYIEARRFASNGGIALCDRYSVPQLSLMDGPNIARTIAPKHRNGLVRRMLKAEENYYQSMRQPDLLIVLRVDPEIAVKRKTTESEHHVRLRSRELWQQDWEGTGAYVIDTSQPLADVVAQAQSIIWAKL